MTRTTLFFQMVVVLALYQTWLHRSLLPAIFRLDLAEVLLLIKNRLSTLTAALELDLMRLWQVSPLIVAFGETGIH